MFYTVKKGDNLTKIAKENDRDLDDLIGMNPQIKNPNLLYPGQKIRLTRGEDEIVEEFDEEEIEETTDEEVIEEEDEDEEDE